MADWKIKLLQIIEASDESQNQVAKALGISNGTLSRWLSGTGEPGISQAATLARRYNLTLDQLFDPQTPLPDEVARTIKIKPSRDEEVRRAIRRRVGKKRKRSG